MISERGALAASAEHSSGWDRLEEVAGRLSRVSRSQRYHVFDIFDWPDSLPSDQYWMSPDLTSCYGTEIWDSLDEATKITLTQYEAVNFFSVNINLIRELIAEVAHRIYAIRFPGLAEFFHDFIHEENEHMWFFARFCLNYGGKIYATKPVAGGDPGGSDIVGDLTVFGRILIAEELCDVFNARMADDERLPRIAQQINATHHEDESRHIAFGRQMMRTLYAEAAATCPAEDLRAAARYLARYVSVCLRSLYNPVVYADTGLEDPYSVRPRLTSDPARRAAHQRFMGRTISFLDRVGVLDSAMVAW